MTSVSITTEKREESVLLHKYKEQIKIIEDKTGINGKYMLTGLLSCGIIIFLGILDSFLTNLIGTILPAYLSLKSIESLEQDIEKQWISYWVIFSLYGVLDKFAGFFIFYIPFYYFLKYLFVLWLFLPNFNGAAQLYEVFIFGSFKKLESLIEKSNSSATRKRVSDPTYEMNINEPIKTISEKTVPQPNTPIKESSNTTDKKHQQTPNKSENIIEKKEK